MNETKRSRRDFIQNITIAVLTVSAVLLFVQTQVYNLGASSMFSRLFSLYVEYFPNYANIYGSIYAVALAMVWLYFCLCIVFLGGALNHYLATKCRNNS